MQRKFLHVAVFTAVLLAACVISAQPATAATAVPPGNITTQTWTLAGSPYVLSGDVLIPPGETLTIEAGVRIDVQPVDSTASGLDTFLVEIWVQGALVVLGTGPNPVRFAALPNADGTAGAWAGIVSAATVSIEGASVSGAQGDNVYALSVNLNAPSYVVCPLFDTSRSFKSGRVVPLKIQLCDATGSNLSDLSLVLTATGLAQLDGSASTLIDAESAGQANADGVFRYDASLGGYVFNLSTAGLVTGTWELRFRVSGDNAVYGVTFDIR